jgi:hypothetical protein
MDYLPVDGNRCYRGMDLNSLLRFSRDAQNPLIFVRENLDEFRQHHLPVL